MGNHRGRARDLDDPNDMAQSKLLTVALTSDDETKTTAYSMASDWFLSSNSFFDKWWGGNWSLGRL